MAGGVTGANLGYFTIYMAACGHSVIAIETFKENVALLQMSLCLNKLEDRVEVFQYGLGTRDASCELASWNINHGGSSVSVFVTLCMVPHAQTYWEAVAMKNMFLSCFIDYRERS